MIRSHRLYYGWWIVVAALGLTILTTGLGYYSYGVFFKPLMGEFGWTRAATSVAQSIYSIMYGAAGLLAGKLIVDQINPAWIIFSAGFYKSRTRRFIKRSSDLIISLAMLIFFLPLIIVIAILIKIDSKGSIIFSQERVGKNKKPYMLYKFRSMVEDAEKHSGPVWASDNDKRITRVGRVIRKWRIDEIPQLWNVLKGDMSFVGPRPEREFFVNDLEEVIPYYGERFSVKPGITGWAQVCYGYGASVDDAVEKVNYDLFYIKNMSTFMDMMIILRTIKIVLFGKGAR